VRTLVFPLPAIQGDQGRGRIRIQVCCTSGPCHPPQVRGGSVLLLRVGKIQSKGAETGFYLNPKLICFWN
jgi:hypothetical protein